MARLYGMDGLISSHLYNVYTCKSYKSFSRSLRSGEAASRPWEMTYN